MTHDFPTIEILRIPFARLTAADALAQIETLYEREEPAFVAHANVHTVNLAVADDGYRDVLRTADMVLNDGKGVMLGARLLGERFPEDLNGNFMTPLVIERAERNRWPTFLLGAKPGIPERLEEVLREQHPSLEIRGTHHGHFGAAGEDDVVARIRDSGAQLLLVGMGNPHQERFLHRRLRDTGVRLGIGVGAYFDFQTGTVTRAPRWMNEHGLEWVYRLVQEPQRMWKRYLVGNPAFVLRVLGSKRSSVHNDR
ncbi:MAG: WecB/TagA/CpsF family glycosyltransferase [Actinomycetota bacterium]|nr:WecB/TagA/CpsF family glycosyltransferase [Actinomycetota bacterium]